MILFRRHPGRRRYDYVQCKWREFAGNVLRLLALFRVAICEGRLAERPPCYIRHPERVLLWAVITPQWRIPIDAGTQNKPQAVASRLARYSGIMKASRAHTTSPHSDCEFDPRVQTSNKSSPAPIMIITSWLARDPNQW